MKLIKSKKNNKAEIKKINGKISNKTEGAFERVKIKGNKKPTSNSLKNEISSNVFKIIINNIKSSLSVFYNMSNTSPTRHSHPTALTT